MAERRTGELRVPPLFDFRAPPRRDQENCAFLLTKTYMDVGYAEL